MKNSYIGRNSLIGITICLLAATPLFGLSCLNKSAEPPSPTPDQSLTPLPFAAYDRLPEQGAENVPIATTISITFSRPPSIVELEMEPRAEIGDITKEIVGVASGRFTFHLAEPLQPNTTYTVTITYGQKEAPEGFRPMSTTTWQFATGAK